MALPPDTGETFLREVDENLRRDQMSGLARKYGGWVVGAVVLLVVAAGGWLYWLDQQRKSAATDSETLSQIYTEIGTGKIDKVGPQLDSLATDGTDAVRATALFTSAAVAIEKNDRPTAIAKFHEVANNKDLAQPYRDLGLIRATSLEFDTIKPEQVIERMAPLTKPGSPWFGSAGELTAMAMLKQGKKNEAGRLFAAIAADRQVPDTIRARAVQIAGSLGVDASASMATLSQ
ncbi:MAG: tetratricopeptide repeat protein [Sphingomicrobium sp.]